MASPSLDQIITEIEQWFRDTMHNSVVSREVAVYNHIQSAYEDLKGRIAGIMTGKPAAAPKPSAEAPAATAAVSEPGATENQSTPAS